MKISKGDKNGKPSRSSTAPLKKKYASPPPRSSMKNTEHRPSEINLDAAKAKDRRDTTLKFAQATALVAATIGIVVVPQPEASLSIEYNQTDTNVDDIATLALELSGIASLHASSAKLDISINPIAIAVAFIWIKSNPFKLLSLIGNRTIEEFFNSPPPTPEELANPDTDTVDLAKEHFSDITPQQLRLSAIDHLQQQGVDNPEAAVSQIERRAEQAVRESLKPDMFLSYSHRDGTALPLAIFNAFNNDQYVVFLDIKSFIGGDHWDILLKNAIQKSKLFIILVGANFEKSFWQNQEKHEAINSTYRKQPLRILPVLIDDEPLPFGLYDLHYLTYRTMDSPDNLISEIRRCVEP